MRGYAQAQAIHDRAVLAARDADLAQLLARPRACRAWRWGQWAQLHTGRSRTGGAASQANPVPS